MIKETCIWTISGIALKEYRPLLWKKSLLKSIYIEMKEKTSQWVKESQGEQGNIKMSLL